jgi:hypothetical protein
MVIFPLIAEGAQEMARINTICQSAVVSCLLQISSGISEESFWEADPNDVSPPRIAQESLLSFVESAHSKELFQTVISLVWESMNVSPSLALASLSCIRGFTSTMSIHYANWENHIPFIRGIFGIAANPNSLPHLRAAAFDALRAFFMRSLLPCGFDEFGDAVISFFEEYKEPDCRIWRSALRFLGAFLHESVIQQTQASLPSIFRAHALCVRIVGELESGYIGYLLGALVVCARAVGADQEAAALVNNLAARSDTPLPLRVELCAAAAKLGPRAELLHFLPDAVALLCFALLCCKRFPEIWHLLVVRMFCFRWSMNLVQLHSNLQKNWLD